MATTTSSQAIIASSPSPDYRPGSNWSLSEIRVPTTLKEGEVLVEMLATGICHTDLALTGPNKGQQFPVVAGHEGSGYIRAVGPNVKKALQPGDPVLLSFAHCAACPPCEAKNPAYCDSFVPLNLFGEKDVFQATDSTTSTSDSADESAGTGIGGQFFGHSSFAKLSVVKESSVLCVKDLISSEEELKLFAPLGCGIQTGVGAVLNLVKPEKEDRVMVCGLGGVGLSAVMGAKLSPCTQIIAVDKVQSRIDLALSLGATHGLNTSSLHDAEALIAAMKATAPGNRGPTVVIETTGFPPILEAAYFSVATKGTFVQVGGPADAGYRLQLDLVQHLFRGVKLWGCVEGDSWVEEFVPSLVRWWREGKLPVDKMVEYYPATEFKRALEDMHSGKTIKPVLVW